MKSCQMCQKHANKANTRSHSNEATIRRQYANLVSRTIKGKKALVCTSCLRTKAKKGIA